MSVCCVPVRRSWMRSLCGISISDIDQRSGKENRSQARRRSRQHSPNDGRRIDRSPIRLLAAARRARMHRLLLDAELVGSVERSAVARRSRPSSAPAGEPRVEQARAIAVSNAQVATTRVFRRNRPIAQDGRAEPRHWPSTSRVERVRRPGRLRRVAASVAGVDACAAPAHTSPEVLNRHERVGKGSDDSGAIRRRSGHAHTGSELSAQTGASE